MYQQIQQRAHNHLQDEQDHQIEQITQIAQHLKYSSQQMNRELQAQHGYAQQLSHEMDLTTNKLNGVQRKLGDLLETNDAGQICTCIMMACLTILFSLLLIIL